MEQDSIRSELAIFLIVCFLFAGIVWGYCAGRWHAADIRLKQIEKTDKRLRGEKV